MAEVVKSPKQCNVCCHESTSWAVGECDHPVCLLCTAKMRVLCNQKDCPVCRLKLDKVIVCKEVKPFSDMSFCRSHGDRKHGIYFESVELAQLYETLRENSCTKCNPKAVFRNFRQLRDHMSKTHDLHYCDICVANLKLLPQEFKAYTRLLLTRHRREGDADDTSHKGHPLCKFCDDRHLDNDALHSHLRTDHFWCHICENDGKQDYFKNYVLLRKHFKEEHYLCEEGPCREEKLTSVFRSKIDLQAHRAVTHTRGLSKAEVKQMKQLELGFSYGSGRGDGGAGARSRGGAYVNPRSGRSAQMREQEILEVATAMSASMQQPEAKKRPKKQSSSPPRKVSLTLEEPKQPIPKMNSQSLEETQPPPGFTDITPKPADQLARKDVGTVETTPSNSNLNSAAISVSAKVSTESVTSSELSKPPGFENVSIPQSNSTSEKNEWPGIITTKSTDIETVRKASQLPVDSELTGLQQPSVVPGSWAKRTVQPEYSGPHVSKKKSKTKPEVPPDTSEEFPPILPSTVHSKPSPQEKEELKLPASRKQLESRVVERIQDLLNKDKDKFTTFKTLSGWYRNSDITVMEYTGQCSVLFGSKWQEVGPLVAEVFPEGTKRVELLSHFWPKPPGSARQNKQKKKKSKASSVWAAQGAPTTSRVTSRPSARNVLSDAEYPTLASASTLPGSKVTSGTSAWNMVVRT